MGFHEDDRIRHKNKTVTTNEDVPQEEDEPVVITGLTLEEVVNILTAKGKQVTIKKNRIDVK